MGKTVQTPFFGYRDGHLVIGKNDGPVCLYDLSSAYPPFISGNSTEGVVIRPLKTGEVINNRFYAPAVPKRSS